QFVTLFNLEFADPLKNNLGETHSAFNHKCLIAEIVDQHSHLAAIIGIDNATATMEMLSECKSATLDDSTVVTVWNLECKARRHHSISDMRTIEGPQA